MRLNKTPLRTSENYGINDIKLDIDMPTITEFENFFMLSENAGDILVSGIYKPNERKEMKSKIGLEINSNFGITLTIPKGLKIDKPIEMQFEFDEDNKVLVDNIKIIYEEDAYASFIIKYFTAVPKEKYFHHLKLETLLKKNANANIEIINLLNKNADSFIAVENSIEEAAKLNFCIIDLGGKTKISNYNAQLVGDNAKNVVKNIYIGNNEDVVDINYNIETVGEKAECYLDAQGAIKDNAKKNFKGTIDFKEGSKKAIGKENENCMILSETAKSKSLPMLLCHEEDVEGEHGVSAGKIEDKKLFYLETRGISKKEAKKLIVKANFSKIIESLKDEYIQKEINMTIDSLLD